MNDTIHRFYQYSYEYATIIVNPESTRIKRYTHFINVRLVDKSLGLMWQRSGSTKFLSRNDVKEYIDDLNRSNFGGFSDWRLPSLIETLQLMEPKSFRDGLYINSIFDKYQKWIWTSDQYGITPGSWIADYYGGGIDDARISGIHLFVRAVRK